MRRHHIDPLSAALGLAATGAGLVVATGHADPLVDQPVWLVAIVAAILGVALVPWRRRGRADDPGNELGAGVGRS